MINYEILKTGSKGNAVIIENEILVDCGVSFKTLKNYYKNFKVIILTHEHKDHLLPETIKKLAWERPSLRWGVPKWLVQNALNCGVSAKNIDIYEMDKTYNYSAFKIIPFLLVHNVLNCGYKIHIGDKKIIYATDTNNLTGIKAKNYDLYLIEANYTEEEIIQRIKEKQSSGEFCYEYQALNNHLSREKAEDFIYKNIGSNGEYVFLHQHEKE